jgi:hypothetical protein
MSTRSSLLLAIVAIFVVSIADADSVVRAQDDSPISVIRRALNRDLPEGVDDAILLGLPKGSQAEVLTWERVYHLALLRSRYHVGSAAALREKRFNLNGLLEEAGRQNVSDFARFREIFFAGSKAADVSRFRDPSADFLELLTLLDSVDNAMRNIAIHENYTKVLMELVKGEASGIEQMDTDRSEETLQMARVELLGNNQKFRNKLDEFKVELGLSPRARIVPDRGSIAKFRVVFHQAARWFTKPDRDLSELDALASQLPGLEDIRIDGLSVQEALGVQTDLHETLLNAGASLAIKNRGLTPAHTLAEEDQIELRVRRQTRRLLETSGAYQVEKRKFVLVIREKDAAQERLIAPPQSGTARVSSVVGDLLAIDGRLVKCQDRLVALWASYNAERIALYRELGTMPYNDWESFLNQFQAARSDPDSRPKKAGVDAPASLRPAPSAPGTVPPPPPKE